MALNQTGRDKLLFVLAAPRRAAGARPGGSGHRAHGHTAILTLCARGV